MSKFDDDYWRRDRYEDKDDQNDEEEISVTSGRVQALSKIFGDSGGSRKSSTYSETLSSTRTTMVTKEATTTDTTITTIQNPRSSGTFFERVKTSSQGSSPYSNYSPSRTTTVTEKTVNSDKDAEDKLYSTLIPSAIKTGSSIDSKTTLTATETVIVKSGTDMTDAEDALVDSLIPTSPKNDYSPTESRNGIKTITTTRTSSTAEDELYGTLLPKGITSPTSLPSPLSSSTSSITKREIITVENSRGEDSPGGSSPTSYTRRTSSYSSLTDDIPLTRTTSYTISSTPSYEYSSLNSPTVFNSESYSKSSRTVLEKDLCTYCRKPFSGEAKMVLDDMKINSHASCFKCEVCNSTLGHMKAGDSLWIYNRMVHCENCFEITRDKWRR